MHLPKKLFSISNLEHIMQWTIYRSGSLQEIHLVLKKNDLKLLMLFEKIYSDFLMIYGRNSESAVPPWLNSIFINTMAVDLEEEYMNMHLV